MIPDRRRGRTMARLSLTTALAIALTGGATAPIAAHAPAPALGSELFAQDARLEYDWRTGAVPPAAMRTAIHAAVATGPILLPAAIPCGTTSLPGARRGRHGAASIRGQPSAAPERVRPRAVRACTPPSSG